MLRFLCAALVWLFAWLSFAPLARSQDLGLSAPKGFAVSLYAGDDLAHDIYSMTINAKGEVVVSGPGYVKTLHDRDGDGRADAATLFSSRPASGAHGMCCDGPDLICTGDNAVMRLRDTDGDGQADGEAEIWTRLRNPEHGANGLVQGPDGCFYLIAGNDAGVSETLAVSPGSPVKQPRCGAVARFSRDGKPLDVFAHGFRNPYDLDFNENGQLFTVDSDGERDHHLPWYAPTRLFDIEQGGEHGWLLAGWGRSWNRPQSYFDNVDRLVEIGRGSPTGLTVYRHRSFPERYQGGVFSACWTLGRVYYLPLVRSQSSYTGIAETFLQATGANGFAPCDLAVGPNGDLFVAMGGRGTRGSVFRVGAAAKPDEAVDKSRELKLNVAVTVPSPVFLTLNAPQPLSSWSRANWVPLAKQAGAEAFRQELEADDRPDRQRIRAAEVLVELFDGVPIELANKVASGDHRELIARVAWALGRREIGPDQQRFLAGLTARRSPVIDRAAWEALGRMSVLDAELEPSPDWAAGFASSDRRVRAAAVFLASGAGAASYARFLVAHPADTLSPRERLAGLQIKHYVDVGGATPPDAGYWTTCLDSLAGDDLPLRLEAARLLQIGLGDMRLESGRADVFAGYLAAHPEYLPDAERPKLVEGLLAAFPSQNAELNREVARLMGMVGAGSTLFLSRIAERWTTASLPTDDIHYLIVSALLPGERSTLISRRAAEAFLRLDKKLAERGEAMSQNWPLRMGEVFDELCRRDAKFAAALADDPQLGRPAHALYVARLTDPDARRRGIEKLLAKAEPTDDPPTPELVDLFGELWTEPAIAYLYQHEDDIGIEDDITLALAKRPGAANRPRFLAALASRRDPVIVAAAKALAQLGGQAAPADFAAAIDALRQTAARPELAAARQSLDALLAQWTGESPTPAAPPVAAGKTAKKDKAAADSQASLARWNDWFAKKYPAEAKALADRLTAGAAGWSERSAKVPWTAGDAQRGKVVFERRECNRCHLAAGRLGPDLSGAVARMSRDDLFTAIIDPSREVSPTYATTLLVNGRGQAYHGILVYDSPESMLVQTGLDGVVRITDTAGLTRSPSRRSLMPDGLLKQASDQDVADLYAYLQTLAKRVEKGK